MPRAAERLALLLALLVLVRAEPGGEAEAEREQLALGERQLGEQIKAILKHYQQADPVGLPGAPVPDPMDVPPMRHSFSMFSMDLRAIKLHGLSRFRIEHARSELALMQASVGLRIASLDVKGLYTLSSWLSRSEGDFTVRLSGVRVQGLARLEVAADGRLRAQDIDMDLTFDDIDMDFRNLGFFAAVFQGVVNSVGSFIFDSIKPYVLQEVNTRVRGQVDSHISRLPSRFPNSISPFDMAVAEARRQLRQLGYDPYRLRDRAQSLGALSAATSHTWLSGLASFYRMGNVTLSMDAGVLYALLDVGTQRIEGRSHWELALVGGVLSRAGTLSFSLEYLRVRLNLSQPLDTRRRARLERLDFELGNLQTRVHGAGTLDYLLEAALNVLPNLLRNQIMDALEGPIGRRVQEELDKVDVEKLIHDKIPDIAEQAMLLQQVVPPADELPLDDLVPALLPDPDDDQTPFSDSEEDRGQS
ncbi:uncharacterized protein LOC131662910 [Phymastichus coffea]|uniref:uncharacterized protein LOC131662910 n=1 Tax=Phymastichus coffea TaxID=108790 RepID=UPI00273B6DDE|nr:uncharacterized protein LOC131662910 [Phymastichus coffea]